MNTERALVRPKGSRYLADFSELLQHVLEPGKTAHLFIDGPVHHALLRSATRGPGLVTWQLRLQ